MSVQERIRALNLQQQQEGGGGAPARPGRPRPSPPAPAPTSSPSAKARLFKAAKVIQKSFDAEADFLAQAHALGPSRGEGDERGKVLSSREGSHEDDELDASAAMQFWKTKGITNEGPLSFKEAKRRGTSDDDDAGEAGEDGAATQSSQHTHTHQSASHAPEPEHDGAPSQEEEDKPPSPPDIVRTANADSEIENDASNDVKYEEGGPAREQDENVHAKDEPGVHEEGHDDDGAMGNAIDHEESEVGRTLTNQNEPKEEPVTENDDSAPVASASTLPQHHVRPQKPSITAGVPYRAYARRSRLRSPRGTGDGAAADVDGTQSVASAASQATAATHASGLSSSLSSRATRFLKGKKDKRRGPGSDAGVPGAGGPRLDTAAEDVALRETASEVRMERKAASGVDEGRGCLVPGGDTDLKTDSPFDEPRKEECADVTAEESADDGTDGGEGTPQTIDVRSAVPATDCHISELNGEAGDHERQRHRAIDPSAPSQRGTTPSGHGGQGERRGDEFPTGLPGKEPGPASDHTSSMDESSYSELNAQDLFDSGPPRPAEGTTRPAAPRPKDPAAEQEEGPSVEGGCQVLDILTDAFTALGAGGPASTVFGSRPGRVVSSVLCADAPSDEDVAIEVEFVENDGDEEHSYAGTGSISVSTQGGDSL